MAEKIKPLYGGTLIEYVNWLPGLIARHGKIGTCPKCGRVGAVRKIKVFGREAMDTTHVAEVAGFTYIRDNCIVYADGAEAMPGV